MDTSAMASMMASPREGHLQTLYCICALKKEKHNGAMLLDPIGTNLDLSKFYIEDWSATPYGDCVEVIPPNTP